MSLSLGKLLDVNEWRIWEIWQFLNLCDHLYDEERKEKEALEEDQSLYRRVRVRIKIMRMMTRKKLRMMMKRREAKGYPR